jgi:peptide/nickel transport system ATP-binding protein
MCDRVGIMYAGKIVEEGEAPRVFERPQHPYTVGLLQALPRHGITKLQRPLATIPGTLPQIGTPLPTCVFVDRCPLATDLCREVEPPVVDVGNGQWTRCHHWEQIGEIKEPVPGIGQAAIPQGDLSLRMENVSKTFRSGGHEVPALVGVELSMHDGETLGLVGESGSGKSTLAKTILGIEGPDPGGNIALAGHELGSMAGDRPSGDKRQIQMVFQNPDSALNRGWSVRNILAAS